MPVFRGSFLSGTFMLLDQQGDAKRIFQCAENVFLVPPTYALQPRLQPAVSGEAPS